MKKIYYLNCSILFGTRDQIDKTVYQIVDADNITKLDFFSGSAKQWGVICESVELEFQKFIATFELIEAAGGIVQNPNGDILMILRNHKWDLPKGKLEPGETIECCALREVEEECAIQNLTLGEFCAHTYHIYTIMGRCVLKKTWWWNMHHSGQGTLKPQTEEGITQVKWVNQAQMADCLQNSYSTIRDLLLKI